MVKCQILSTKKKFPANHPTVLGAGGLVPPSPPQAHIEFLRFGGNML